MGRSITAFNGPGNGSLPPRQERVALALASGRSLREAAGECHTGETTIKRWLREPAFLRRVAELRRELTSRALGRLADAMAGPAADTLFELLGAKAEKVRLDAAKAFFELGQKLIELEDLKERLAALEDRQPGRPR
jgi:hypothetical protein